MKNKNNYKGDRSMKRILKWTLIVLGFVAIFAHPASAMGIIAFGTVASASTINAMIKNFNALFNEAQAAQTPAWPSYAMRVNSEGASEDYQWLGDTPAMREWLGEKFLKDMRGFTFSVPNKNFEATVKVSRNDIEDDRLGKYGILIPQLADEGTVKQDSLLMDLRVAGTTTDIYDGKKFYAANHVTGKSGSQSNLLTGTGHTLAQVTADLISARTALRRFMTDQGKPFIRESGKLKLQIQAPPDLEYIFETIRNSKTISASDNTLYQAFEYQISQYLTDTDDWYVDYVGARVRPFVLQMRKEPHLVIADDPKSETMFMRAEYLFSNEARFNAAYGLWPYSIQIHNT
jgi:phage major head subunit gpT-like protein